MQSYMQSLYPILSPEQANGVDVKREEGQKEELRQARDSPREARGGSDASPNLGTITGSLKVNQVRF